MTSLERCWIQSYTGRKVTPMNLREDQVCIEDIAHALANKGRFTGHAKFFYSVGQHTILGADAIAKPFKLAFLLHELSEVYLPDVAGPLKPFVRVADQAWEEFEKRHTSVMLRALGLSHVEPLIYSPEVRNMDLRMLMTEKEVLHPGEPPEPWGLEEAYPVLPGVPINDVASAVVEREWLYFFRELTR